MRGIVARKHVTCIDVVDVSCRAVVCDKLNTHCVVISIRHHSSAVIFHAVKEYCLILDIAEIFRLREHGDYVIDIRSFLNIALEDFAAVIDLNIESCKLSAPRKSSAVIYS